MRTLPLTAALFVAACNPQPAQNMIDAQSTASVPEPTRDDSSLTTQEVASRILASAPADYTAVAATHCVGDRGLLMRLRGSSTRIEVKWDKASIPLRVFVMWGREQPDDDERLPPALWIDGRPDPIPEASCSFRGPPMCQRLYDKALSLSEHFNNVHVVRNCDH